MDSYDFDHNVQKKFNESFSDIGTINWKCWLEISSREEYEELSLKLSGLSSFENIFKSIKTEMTDSRNFSVDIENLLNNFQEPGSPVFCHTSGTTNSNLSMLKWFHMTKNIVKRLWVPGMQAIFESSGLDSNSSAVIFVPTRLKFDGIRLHEDNSYISLYSSEFSQRIMLSVIKPKSYLFYEYKNSRNLEVISKILTMDDISVISAPALTVLGWANINRLQEGIRRSLDLIGNTQNPELGKLLQKIEKYGILKFSKKIQNELSEKLAGATLVFSISSLSESNWELIRKFMKWDRGKEKFTNLYVASEIGPFAASIKEKFVNEPMSNSMYIFPLTIPVIEFKGQKKLISRTKNKLGKLYVSRLNNSEALINIDIGDVISIKNQEGLPQIDGKILRSKFQIKYPIEISREIGIQSNYTVYAGDFFTFPKFEIYYPRFLLNCLKKNCDLDIDSLLLVVNKESVNNYLKLFLYSDDQKNCSSLKNYSKILVKCIKNEKFKEAILNHDIEIELIKSNPIDFLKTRSKMLENVRNGKTPKGVLKKWPLYVLET